MYDEQEIEIILDRTKTGCTNDFMREGNSYANHYACEQRLVHAWDTKMGLSKTRD
jgi:hypothetical protein